MRSTSARSRSRRHAAIRGGTRARRRLRGIGEAWPRRSSTCSVRPVCVQERGAIPRHEPLRIHREVRHPNPCVDSGGRLRRSWASDGAVPCRVCGRLWGARVDWLAWREIRWEGGDTVVNATGHLLTAGELAERWQVPKGHVYRLTRDGLIPAVRLGRYYRYRVGGDRAVGGRQRADRRRWGQSRLTPRGGGTLDARHTNAARDDGLDERPARQRLHSAASGGCPSDGPRDETRPVDVCPTPM